MNACNTNGIRFSAAADGAGGLAVLGDPLAIIRGAVEAAIGRAFGGELPAGQGVDAAVTTARDVKFGDFQCNAAMGLGKVLGKPPREVAKRLVAAAVELGTLGTVAEPLTEASIAGPGFINIRLRGDALAGMLKAASGGDLGLPPVGAKEARRVVVDLCGVNLAKEMHVGHLRATVIGDTLARVFERLGHTVVRQNHVGDWGVPIAMVTHRLKGQAERGEIDLAKLTLADLDRAYKAAKREGEADERGLAAAVRWGMGPKADAELTAQVEGAREVTAAAKGTLLKLQAKEPAVLAVWQRISDVTMAECLATCARLNAVVLPEHSAGESAYAEELGPLVADLEGRGIATVDAGALVVRVDDVEAGLPPVLIRKSDGGYLYATTDLAAIRHRVGKLKADRVVYCVGAPQALHFKQVFAAAHKAGYTAREGRSAVLEHAAFGAILGEDGKPFRTRSGESAKLGELIDEAEGRALAAVTANNPDLPAGERAVVARAVAVAALRYGDLSSERIKDYVFSADRMVAFEGDTGPYLLYALVRVRNIFRKAAEQGVEVPGAKGAGEFKVEHAAEKGLALALLAYPAAVRGVAETLLPHRLCQTLYGLARAFSTFYDACPVLNAPTATVRAERLALCGLTERVLADGLTVLGIPTVERM